MPSAAERAAHRGVARVRTKKMPNGTTVRIYFYNDHSTYVERVKKRRGTKRK